MPPLRDLSCLYVLDFIVYLNVMSFSYVYVNTSYWLGDKSCPLIFGVKAGLVLAPVGPTRAVACPTNLD